MSLGAFSLGSVSLGGSLVVVQDHELELLVNGSTSVTLDLSVEKSLALSVTGQTDVSLGLTVDKELALSVTGQTVVEMGLVAAIPIEIAISGGTVVVLRLRVTRPLVAPKPTPVVSDEPFPFDILADGADVQFDQQLVGSGNLRFDREARPREMVFDL